MITFKIKKKYFYCYWFLKKSCFFHIFLYNKHSHISVIKNRLHFLWRQNTSRSMREKTKTKKLYLIKKLCLKRDATILIRQRLLNRLNLTQYDLSFNENKRLLQLLKMCLCFQHNSLILECLEKKKRNYRMGVLCFDITVPKYRWGRSGKQLNDFFYFLLFFFCFFFFSWKPERNILFFKLLFFFLAYSNL